MNLYGLVQQCGRCRVSCLFLQIASRLNKLAPQIPAVANASALQIDRPTAVILDEKGRAVDDKGHEIQMHYEPTLKANMRAKKRDELRENLKVRKRSNYFP